VAWLGEHDGANVRSFVYMRSQDWRGAAAAVAAAAGDHAAAGVAPPVVLVAGGKGVGKSTLCRLVVNTLLSGAACPMGVAVLDADCGQPELGLPGKPLGWPRS
jgi:polynucleotide 5'-kinase involved in rRNA processing